MKANAAALAETEIAGIGKIATRTVNAWRARRDANVSQTKRETHYENGTSASPGHTYRWELRSPNTEPQGEHGSAWLSCHRAQEQKATATQVVGNEGNGRDSQQRFQGERDRNTAGVREGGTCTPRKTWTVESRVDPDKPPQFVQVAKRPHPPLKEAGGKEQE